MNAFEFIAEPEKRVVGMLVEIACRMANLCQNCAAHAAFRKLCY